MADLKRFAIGLCAVSLLAVACGDDNAGSPEGGAITTNIAVAPSTTVAKAPVKGGTLTFGVFTELLGTDPILVNGSGATGGSELGAIYDRLIQWNPSTKTYDPKTAQSLESNAEYTEWTLKLRPSIKFGDGTPYDA